MPRHPNQPVSSPADIQKALATLNRPRGRATTDARSELLSSIRYYWPSLPAPEVEYVFHPTRKWKFDIAWPDLKIAVEIEGLVYSNRSDNQLQGRHVSVTGFKKDIEKYGAAFALGWYLLRVTSTDARNGTALNWLDAHMYARELLR